MPLGQRNYFPNPYDKRTDSSHASIFLVVLALLVGVGVILFDGSADLVPKDTAALFPTDLSAVLGRGGATTRVTPGAGTPIAVSSDGGQAASVQKPQSGSVPGAAASAQVTPQAAAPTPIKTQAGSGVIANSGNGVYLRRSPNPDDRLVAWSDGTPLALLGEETDAAGMRWVKVRDPRGNEGWLPKAYVSASR